MCESKSGDEKLKSNIIPFHDEKTHPSDFHQVNDLRIFIIWYVHGKKGVQMSFMWVKIDKKIDMKIQFHNCKSLSNVKYVNPQVVMRNWM